MFLNKNLTLCEFGQKIGYYANSQGICYGITLSWLEAKLTHQANLHSAIVNRAISIANSSYSSNNFLNDIQRIKEKVKASQLLRRSDREKLEILAFFDRISLYQDPELHSDLFDNYYMQSDIEKISQLASSQAVIQHSGLSQLHAHCGVYNSQELTDYLKNIRLIIDSLEYSNNEIIGFCIGSMDHTVGLTYDTQSRQFTFMDSNLDSSFTGSDENKITSLMFKSFAHQTPYRTFNTIIITLADIPHIAELQEALNSLKTSMLNDLKPQVITRDTDALLIAALSQDKQTLEKYIELGADISIADENGVSALLMASLTGNTEIIELLLQHNADIHQETLDGATAIFIAADARRHNALKVLIKAGADVNHIRQEEPRTALLLAIGNNDEISAEILSKAGASLSENERLTPVLAPQRSEQEIANTQDEWQTQSDTDESKTAELELKFFRSEPKTTIDKHDASTNEQQTKRSNKNN